MLSRLRCSRLPSRAAQPLPPEIERRDRERQYGSFRASRASRVAPDSGKAPETWEKTRPRLLPVEIGQSAWRWGESGANRSRPLDAAIAPRPAAQRSRGSWEPSGNPRLTLRRGWGGQHDRHPRRRGTDGDKPPGCGHRLGSPQEEEPMPVSLEGSRGDLGPRFSLLSHVRSGRLADAGRPTSAPPPRLREELGRTCLVGLKAEPR